MDTLINPDIWAKTGGLAGLVMLALFLLVALLVRQLFKMLNRMMDEVTQTSARLVDFKTAVYEAGLLPDRRGKQRGDDDP